MLLVTLILPLIFAHSDVFALDFHHAFWPAGSHVLRGESPYVDATSPDVVRDTAFVYPAVAALLFALFAALPLGVADVVFTILCIVSMALAMRLAGVRDKRVFALVFASAPVVIGYQSANVSLPLCLGLACLWRWRERPLASGALVAVMVSVKLFLWPLGLWLIATRHYISFGYALLTGLAINVAAWTVLGWDQLGRYDELARALAKHQDGRNYGPISVALQNGVARGPAYVLGLGLAGIAIAGCVALARRGREAPALALCVAASMLATPVLWPHYFALLIVPLALTKPRLSPIWLVPLAMWACPSTDPATWQALIALAAGAVLVAVAAASRDGDEVRPGADGGLSGDRAGGSYGYGRTSTAVSASR